jgi:hypothetical protein
MCSHKHVLCKISDEVRSNEIQCSTSHIPFFFGVRFMYHEVGSTRLTRNVDICIRTSLDGVTFQKTTTAYLVTADRTLYLTQ